MKKCNKCGEVLPLHMFWKNKATKDKLSTLCKECERKKNKTYRDKNKEEMKKYSKAYYEENKEGINEKAKVYYGKNKEEMRKKNKAYRDKNKEEIRKKKKTYYEGNKEEKGEYQRERVLKLPDPYVRQLLNTQGIDASLITPELIELKRAILKVTRIIKQKESKNI